MLPGLVTTSFGDLEISVSGFSPGIVLGILNYLYNTADSTGCLKKNARLRLEAYNSSLEAAVGACNNNN